MLDPHRVGVRLGGCAAGAAAARRAPPPRGGDRLRPPPDAPPEQSPSGYSFLRASGDDGASWSHSALPGFVFSENPRFAAAPPAPGQATTAGGYPDVTYWCGNRDVGLTAPLILERECYRSLDAGVTWEQRSVLFTNPVPQHSECGTNREDISSGDGNNPPGASDCSLYLMLSCGGTVYLARSTDEAATFPIMRTPSGPVTLPVPAGSGAFGWP